MDARTPDTNSGAPSLLLRGAVLTLLLGGVAFLCVQVLRPFLSSMVWAAILAYASWPLYQRLRMLLGKRDTVAATVMTLLAAAVAILPLIWLLVLVQHELVDGYRSFSAYLARGPHPLPELIRDIPWLGPWLQDGLNRYAGDPTAFGRETTDALTGREGLLGVLLREVGRSVGRLLLTLVMLFVFYRNGELLAHQIQRIATRFFDHRVDRFAQSAVTMTRAVVYGLLVTAVAQGLVAGIGYGVVGLEAPAVLGGITGLMAPAPVLGTAFVWAPLGVGLVLAGQTWKGVLLLAWGTVLVYPIDYVLRPLLISNVTRVPFLLVMFGALGGLAAFGLVGLFVGPVLLGVASATWREAAAEGGRSPADGGCTPRTAP